VPKTKACGYRIAAFAGDDNKNQNVRNGTPEDSKRYSWPAGSAMLKRDQWLEIRPISI
jgi:hypothetical protein